MKKNPPKAFISYSWDNPDHEEWVNNLADQLQESGIEVIFDKYNLALGKELTAFMEISIQEADKVLIIMTNDYKNRADNRKSGVGYEYSLITSELYKTQNSEKFIPILRTLPKEESIPKFLESRIYLDMTNDRQFESNLFRLRQNILNKPEIKIPKIGILGEIKQENLDPILSEAKSYRAEINKNLEKKRYSASPESIAEANKQVFELYKLIEIKATNYKTATGFFFIAKQERYDLILLLTGYSIKFSWAQAYSNTAEDSKLIVTLWDGYLSFKNDYFFNEQPHKLDHWQYSFELSDKEIPSWLEDKSQKHLSYKDICDQFFLILLRKSAENELKKTRGNK